MLGSTSWSRAALAGGFLSGLATFGCIDTQERLDTFIDDTDEFRTVDEVQGSGRFDVTGKYFLALAAGVDPAKPLLFMASVEVDSTVDPWQISLSLTPLALEGRAEVGTTAESGPRADVPGTEQVSNIEVGPVDLNEDGTFRLDFGEVNFDGSSDPLVIGAPIVATLWFPTGSTQSTDFFCGIADGAVTLPAGVPLTGSTFGAIRLTEDNDITTMEYISACPAEDTPDDE